MTLRVTILSEAGYSEALLGLSLSHNQPPENMPPVAARLASRDGGHNKFLESVVVWLDITAPRYWWQQFDTYRVGVTKQSASTMHTILQRPLTPEDFAAPLWRTHLERINDLREFAAAGIVGAFAQLKSELPEGFLQRRIVCTNYKALRHIVAQRRGHKLPEWAEFIAALDELEHGEWLA